MMIDRRHTAIPIKRQAELLEISRSSVYYQPKARPENEMLMRLIDRIYLENPCYGSRKITRALRLLGHRVNRKRAQRLMRQMGIQAIYPKPNLSRPHPDHPVYPYLLRGVAVDHCDQVWCSDITYIPLRRGWAYLVAIIDWHSRYLVSWELSASLESDFCQVTLKRALETATPEIFNTDQGRQFTATDFTRIFEGTPVKISMDGRGRAIDNIIIERFWRTLKYEEVYLRDYNSIEDAKRNIAAFVDYYNRDRLHQTLGYQTPDQVYHNHTQQLAA
jgi:putative transposase